MADKAANTDQHGNLDAIAQGKPTTAAQRALDEAAERRKDEEVRAREIGGRGGLDPARFGDWEVKGLASDF